MMQYFELLKICQNEAKWFENRRILTTFWLALNVRKLDLENFKVMQKLLKITQNESHT